MKNRTQKHLLLYDIALVFVILAGFWFRSVGLDWDEGQHLHPDERFLTMVESAIVPVGLADETIGAPPEGCDEWGGYFDTKCSSLNPHNRGHGFFVYGTLPIFATRYLAEWTGETGYGSVHLVGRQLSALADLLSIVLLYFIVARVYNKKVALLSAALSAFAVLQIQQSHFFTVDTFVNLFMFLAIYFAVEIAFYRPKTSDSGLQTTEDELRNTQYAIRIFKSPLFWLSIGFGLALGMAVASKINAAVLAALLPAALLYHFYTPRSKNFSPSSDHRPLNTENWTLNTDNRPLNTDHWKLITIALITGALASLIAFRIFQPYAFSGPGFFGVLPNQTWVDNIASQRAQASGDADLPFAFQWARRSHLYSFENLTKWGLGLPLGILAWAGFLLMGWRILKGEKKHLLLWGWTAAYFLWQSLQFNPTMRYQLPIYPLLAMMAAWVALRTYKSRFTQSALRLTGIIVLILTALWAYAFVQIYQRPHTRVAASRWIYNNVPAAVNLHITQGDGEHYQQPIRFPQDTGLSQNAPYTHHFIANASGLLEEISFASVYNEDGKTPQTLTVKLARQPGAPPDETLATVTHTSTFAEDQPLPLPLDAPIALIKDQPYVIEISTDGNFLALKGSAVINESSWDDGLPLRVDGYDAFGGLFQPGLNMEMYWADDQAKIDRFVTNLEQGDYLFISSNRQWASLPRVPERYPLTKAYYEHLIGCPPGAEVIWCYNTARPGDFDERLGYELVAVFESFPTLEIPGVFHWEANDQFAEEAFTVYDHTKALIFQKTDAFDAAQVRALLNEVDLSNVIHLTPKAAGKYKAPEEKSLMLTEDEWARQRAGGTWSELFNTSAWKNKYPVLGLLLWYLTIFILGLFTYPIVRRVFPGLADKGYPLSRAFGMLLLAYVSWLLGSLGVTYSRLTIGLVFAGIVLVGGWLGYKEFFANRPLPNLPLAQHPRRRAKGEGTSLTNESYSPPSRKMPLKADGDLWRKTRRYYLMIELLFLALFLLDLGIRIANPDLWHPSKGGERPMDLSYLHAVLKSTTFPPYDPWFAGGYLNYYYFGFVLVGTPLKLLGLTPTTAYNYILPTLFALVGVGAFSIGWNLLGKKKLTTENTERTEHFEKKEQKEKSAQSAKSVDKLPLFAGLASAAGMLLLGNLSGTRKDTDFTEKTPEKTEQKEKSAQFAKSVDKLPLFAGLASAAGMLLLGNLGTVRAFYHALQRIVDSNGHYADIPIYEHLWLAAQGLFRLVAKGAPLPMHIGDWYWFPSRVIPAPGDVEPITEFPLFTFLYSDLHAHMIVLPFAVLAIAWALSFLHARVNGKKNLFGILLEIAGASLIVGAMRPTNTWDLYAYFPLLAIVIAYALFRFSAEKKQLIHRSAFIILPLALFFILTNLFYQPYIANFGQAYGEIRQWTGTHTPLASYFTQWGLFLFVIVSWMWWETHEWMAETPLSALKKLQREWIYAGALLFFALLIGLAYLDVKIGWIVVPLLFGAGLLILKRNLGEGQRLVLFLTGTGLALTLVVEVIVLSGDIGRMNTVFKLYLQTWTFFAFSAGAAFGWLLPEIRRWTARWQSAWKTTGMVLLAGALLFTLTGSLDKMRDRVRSDAPPGLDGMKYMESASHWDGEELQLGQDYAAILWMRENVEGSPVIVEANTPEYRWGSRYTIYTGLPGVVGWNWHQRQQRALNPTAVTNRVAEIKTFYETTNLDEALTFIEKYHVEYIIVGQVEQVYYPGAGLAKFAAQDGVLWEEVFREGETVVYRVIE